MAAPKFVQIAAVQHSHYPIIFALDEDGLVWENRYGTYSHTWDGWARISLTDNRPEGY